MKRLYILFVMVSGLLLAGCFQKSLTPKEYFNWAKTKESGLTHTRAGNGVNFHLQYRPADLMIANEIKNGVISPEQSEKRKEELGSLTYFLLKIESGEQDLLMHDLADEQQYVQRVNYYSLDFQYDIIAVADGDTIPCVLYQFENAYGITPYINVSLAFPGDLAKANVSGPVEILVNDRVFGNGILNYTFGKNAFYDLPELIIE